MRSTWTDSRLDEFTTETGGRFDQVDARFDKVDRRFDKVEGRLDKVDRRFDKVEGRLDMQFGELDRRLRMVEEGLGEIRRELIANSRSMLQFCGVMVAAQMATVATLIAFHGG